MPPMTTRIVTLALLLPLAACSRSPDDLAAALQAALRAGDQDAALALASLEDAPAQLHYFYLDQVNDCTEPGTTCTVSALPLDEKFAVTMATLSEQGLEATVEPEGLIVVEARQENGTATLRMPYARVDGDYRIVSQRYTAAKLQELRATDSKDLLQSLLDVGIYDAETSTRHADWITAATPLPAGGGEPGEAYVRQVRAMAEAARAGDPDAAALGGGGLARQMVGATDYAGNPVPLDARKRKLRAQSARMLHDVRIEGGYLQGKDAVLLFEGRNGIGWVQRGVVHLHREEHGWDVAGRREVSYPDA